MCKHIRWGKNGRWQVEVTCEMEEWVLVEHESQGNQS